MIKRANRYLVDGMPSMSMLCSVLKEHLANVPRLERLRRYYSGESAIMSRTRASGLPNNRISHPYARYIVSVATGYLAGQPVSYSVDGDGDALRPISEAYDRCEIHSVDAENARHASIYGRAIEYIHAEAVTDAYGNERGVQPCAVALPTEQAFVVYDDDYHISPLFGVYYAPNTNANGKQDGYRIWVSGDEIVREYLAKDLITEQMEIVNETRHYFGGVPMVEYWNDEDERGDFEWVIPLIDAYDKLESDRVNDKEQFVDKLLLLTGCTIEQDELGRPPWQQLREDKALCLPDLQAKAEYLQGALTESDVEVLRSALIADIHKMSMIPDLSDRDFAQNSSGVAMRYKLWGLEQLTNIKQQWFTEGLRSRLRLFANFSRIQGNPALDVDSVKIIMTRAMPANALEYAELAQMAEAAGAASLETKVRILHSADAWTDDMVDAEVERIKSDTADRTPSINALLGATAENPEVVE